MPIRKPAPLTTARANGFQDRTIDVASVGLRDPIPLLASPVRMQKQQDMTTSSPTNGRWDYDAAAGYLVSTGAHGASFDDYACAGVDIEEGDEVVGWRALLYKTNAVSGTISVGIMAVVDGAFPPITYVGNSELTADSIPVGQWTWLEHTFTPFQLFNRSIGLGLRAAVSSPGQRFAMGFVLVQRPV